nr:Biomphalaria glabrata actophorin-like [Biomphalaria glabrata]
MRLIQVNAELFLEQMLLTEFRIDPPPNPPPFTMSPLVSCSDLRMIAGEGRKLERRDVKFSPIAHNTGMLGLSIKVT